MGTTDAKLKLNGADPPTQWTNPDNTNSYRATLQSCTQRTEYPMSLELRPSFTLS